ncbi:MAG: type II secretion system protein [Cytophagaceae bacterium]|nr:MAG: type II secretion system protein [Cytophagaceae bacterium]
MNAAHDCSYTSTRSSTYNSSFRRAFISSKCELTSGKDDAFTLVELLVTLTVIGMLAALLFPVFAKARDSARMTTCASNLRQIGTALAMYQQDYEGSMPLDQFGDSVLVPELYNPLKSYISGGGTYHCPDGDMKRVTDYEYVGVLWYPTKQALKLEPLNVTAYCDNHTRRGEGRQDYFHTRDGSLILLRANGSVQRVPGAKVTFWGYDGSKWQTYDDLRSQSSSATLDTDKLNMRPVLPDEPWPPHIEK